MSEIAEYSVFLEPGCSLADITSIPVWLAAGIRLMIPRTHEDGTLDCDIRAGSARAGTSEYSLKSGQPTLRKSEKHFRTNDSGNSSQTAIARNDDQ